MKTLPFGPLAVVFWLALYTCAAVLYRKVMGKPTFPGRPEHALFFEKGVSGRSRMNLLTLLGGARRCLCVAVTAEAVTIRPTFPFNLFLVDLFGLEHVVDRRRIDSALEIDGFMGKLIRLDFTNAKGSAKSMDLRLANTQGFLKALEK